jgi:hypothetical protein
MKQRLNDAQRLGLVRFAHTLIYLVMASSVFALFYAGVVGAQGWWLWAALGLVAIEATVFAGSGMKCPLTAVASRYGAKPGADTLQPEHIARYTLRVFGPLILISLTLIVARWCGFLH